MPLICLLLMPIMIAPLNHLAALACRIVGTGGMLSFVAAVIGRWFAEPQHRASVSTAWLIIAVGLLDIPLAMPALGLETAGIGAMCFMACLALAAAIYTVLLPRHLFEAPPPLALGLAYVLLAVATLRVAGLMVRTARRAVEGLARRGVA